MSYKSFFYLFLLALIFPFDSCKKKEKSTLQEKPNIIFLLTDDQRWDALGVMGNPILKTPHIDKLAKEGILFDNAYVTTSICAVSRASMLSGQYLSRHGIDDFNTSFSPDALAETYPIVMKNSGYRIGFIGKYGVGSSDTHPKDAYDFWECTTKTQPLYENLDEDGNYIHYTDVVGNSIKSFLNTSDIRPFCLSVSFKAPHVQDGDPRQFIPNPRYNNYYKDIEIPQPKTAAPKYWESFPPFFQTEENIARERWKLRFNSPEKYQESVRNYYRLLTGVDDVVGELIAELKEKNLDKNTIIIYMGDNGMFLGEHGMAGKWYPYEESVRVPLLIFDPRTSSKKIKGRKTDIALNIDIAPTILGFAGIKPLKKMQGIDLIQHVANARTTRQEFFYEHNFFGSPKLPKVEGVINPELKYILYTEHGYEELFDLTKDPYEETNLVSHPAYKEVLLKQRQLYLSLKKDAK
ncbi:sulfatase family protein [Eudoraea chungangensis]|uniref:sulfatase family protein n=1 Tax=Eudoraea chungangensis TaxID=1481905 RepID=UPI0023EC2D1B|nr:sulfatase [Eudoraea chungangensis]